jgi:L-threonylcarbamoyladenylate synthase
MDHLERGLAIAVPGPASYPYVVTGISAAVVNTAKGRPVGQPVVLVVADIKVVAPFVDLNDEGLSYATWLSANQLIHLLVPVEDQVPPWAQGAVAKGMLGLSMAWRPDLRFLFGERGYLFASSANITGDAPVGTAAEADRLFRSNMLVIDGDATRNRSEPTSGMIVTVKNGLITELVRPGFQNQQANTTPESFVALLPSLWHSHKP